MAAPALLAHELCSPVVSLPLPLFIYPALPTDAVLPLPRSMCLCGLQARLLMVAPRWKTRLSPPSAFKSGPPSATSRAWLSYARTWIKRSTRARSLMLSHSCCVREQQHCGHFSSHLQTTR